MSTSSAVPSQTHIVSRYAANRMRTTSFLFACLLLSLIVFRYSNRHFTSDTSRAARNVAEVKLHGPSSMNTAPVCSSDPWDYDGTKLMEFEDWVDGLKNTERKVFSQNGEDGVIEAIFDRLGEGTKYYVEFGCQSGIEINTRFLREQKGWTGLLLDGDNENLSINLRREFLTASQICRLFEKYLVPQQIDLLSVDIDFKTMDVLEQILLCGYSPRVLVVEYNSALGEFTSVRVPPTLPETMMWSRKDNYFGASMLAITKILRAHRYSLLYADSLGVNLFFARDDQIGCVDIAISNLVRQKFVAPGFGLALDKIAGFPGGHPADLENRKYTLV